LSLHDFSMQWEHPGLLDPTQKYVLLREAPFDVLMRLVRTLWRHVFDWTGQMVGIFGWMDVPFYLPLRLLGFLWLVGVVVAERPAKPNLNKP
ncbi:hypothetical protein, partial [Klebsiella pneumoniae]|uniref:hypothetical protein n=1 Tax=Klebsiella pneumoniae TaxID=573 RepID=UPI0038549738